MPKAPRVRDAARSTQAAEESREPQEGAQAAPPAARKAPKRRATGSSKSTKKRNRTPAKAKGKAKAQAKRKAAKGAAKGPVEYPARQGKGTRKAGRPKGGKAGPPPPPDKPLKAPRSRLPALVPIILARIAGGETVRAILAEPDMPHRGDFYAYILDPERADLADQYARARESQAHCLADDILEIADDDSRDSRFDHERGEYVMDGEFVQRSRIRIDTRKWILARIHPKAYGDRLDVTSDNKPMGGVVVLPAEQGPR